MELIMKKLVYQIIILLIILLAPIEVNAEENLNAALTPSLNSAYRNYDYVINAYDINIKVNENNTFDITENITAYFNIPKHGIYRKIPLKNTLIRNDGIETINNAQVTNIKVNKQYTTGREGNNYIIKIGSPNNTLTGTQKYTISYKYNIGKDPLNNMDELYYNIIGNDWDTVIGNITFNISMPKEFDSSKLGFSSGIYGSVINNVTYFVDGNEIKGNYNGILNKGESITIRCSLNEGYFQNAGLIMNKAYYLFLIPIIFLIISIIIWFKYGKEKKYIETIEFYPPQGFNSLEVGFLSKCVATNKDVISLLIYLANKGYLKISETPSDNLLQTSKKFTITKLKDYDGNNTNEKIFFNGLFNISAHKNNPNEVSSKDLKNKFYRTINKVLDNINTKENIDKITEKVSKTPKNLIFLMILLSRVITFLIPIIINGVPNEVIVEFIFPLIGDIIIYSALSIGKDSLDIYGKPELNPTFSRQKIFIIIAFSLLFCFMPLVTAFGDIFIDDIIFILGYLIAIICKICMALCMKYISKRNDYGIKMYSKIKGFKRFLETAEKDKLEELVNQDPEYFYNILPYTYVLNVSNKWIKKFESIAMQPPSWYDNSTSFDMDSFGTFMHSTMSSAQKVMSSSPKSKSYGGSSCGGSSGSSGGGSSGGGSSGGGSGGGGGGSW
jgi:uncharacterized membrane protein YgcG